MGLVELDKCSKNLLICDLVSIAVVVFPIWVDRVRMLVKINHSFCGFGKVPIEIVSVGTLRFRQSKSPVSTKRERESDVVHSLRGDLRTSPHAEFEIVQLPRSTKSNQDRINLVHRLLKEYHRDCLRLCWQWRYQASLSRKEFYMFAPSLSM